VQSIIQPRFIGDAVGLSVTVTFVVLFFWAWLLGPLGAILAIPLTLLAKALLVDIDPKARWADALLRSSAKEPDPAEPPPVKKPRRRWRGHGADQLEGAAGESAELPARTAPDMP
jgi:AI-2 transport protein TqsA